MNNTAKNIIEGLVVVLLGAGIVAAVPAVTTVIVEASNSMKSQSIHTIDSEGKQIGEVKIESVIGNTLISREKTDSNGDHTIYYKSNVNSQLQITAKKDGYKSKTIFIDSALPPINKEIQMLPELSVLNKPAEKYAVSVEGKDENNRKVKFIFKSFSNNEYAWDFGATNKLKNVVTNEIFDAKQKLLQILSRPEENDDIVQSQNLIAVGIASCEGDEKIEGERAEKRASIVYDTLSELPNRPQGNTYKLLLGKYTEANCLKQSQFQKLGQRKLVIISVQEKDNNVNLRNALKDAMQRVSMHPSDDDVSAFSALDAKQYSRFELRE
jgi:hypothetical protein